MRWTSLTALLLALASLGLVARFAFRSTEFRPEELHERATAQLASPQEGSTSQVLGAIERGLASSPDLDEGVRARLLLDAARLHRLAGSPTRALQSYQELRVSLGRSDEDALFEETETLLLLGQLEEAWQLCNQLEASPEHKGRALSRRGWIERRKGDQALQVALDELSVLLAGDLGRQAAQDAAGVAARAIEDPSRAQLIGRLQAALEVGRDRVRGAEILGHLDDAATLYTQARETLGLALETSFDAEAFSVLLELLQEAGQAPAAAELAAAAHDVLVELREPTALLAALRAFQEVGQASRATHLMEALLPYATGAAGRELEGEDLLELSVVQAACEIGFSFVDQPAPDPDAARLVPQLANAWRTRAIASEARIAGWYAGMTSLLTPPRDGSHRLSLVDRGLRNLEPFLAERPGDHLPAATARGLLAAAAGYRDKGELEAERGALTEGLALGPELDGEAWVRLSHLQERARNTGARVAEESLTQGLRLLPNSVEDHLERWLELGRQGLSGESRSLTTMRTVLDSGSGSLRDHGPAARYLLAEALLEEDDANRALGVSRRLVEDFPGLLPAIDLELECLLQLGLRIPAGLLLVQRLRIAGPNQEHREFLERLGTDKLDDALYLELTELDPRGEGRLAVAEHALGRGDAETALLALGGGSRPVDSGLHELLRAEALLEQGLQVRAAQAAGKALASPRTRAEAWSVLFRARARANPDVLAATVTAFLAQEDAELLETNAAGILDSLLEAGRTEAAAAIATRLDENPLARGRGLLERLLLIAVLRGDDANTREVLDRWEAFVEDGSPDLARLVLAMEAQDWTDLPTLGTRLAGSALAKERPWMTFLSLVAREDLETAAELVAEGLEEAPNSTAWLLASGALARLTGQDLVLPDHLGSAAATELENLLSLPDGQRLDPRRLLALAAALELPGWGLWVLPRLGELADEPTGLWEALLAEEAQVRLGRADLAEQARSLILERFPAFSPAWERAWLASVRAAKQDTVAPSVLEARANWLQAARGARGTAPESAIDRALLALALDRQPAAKQLLARHVEADEADAPALWLLGRLHLEDGETLLALGAHLRAWRLEAATRAKLVPGNPRTREFLATLSSAQGPDARRTLLPQDAIPLLEEVLAACPEDPFTHLALLDARFTADSRNVGLAALRAEAALRDLARRQMEQGGGERPEFERIADEAAEAWGAWLVDSAPTVAETYLTSELERSPGNTNLRMLRARGRLRAGDLDGCEGDLEILQAAARSRTAALLHAQLLAQGGGTREALGDLLEGYAEIQPWSEDEATFLSFADAWTSTQRPRGRGARALRPLRASLSVLTEPGEAHLQGSTPWTVLMAASSTLGQAGDLAWMEKTLRDLEAGAAPGAQDPYVRPVGRALLGLARRAQPGS